MAAAVAVPVSIVNQNSRRVLPPSALAQHAPRHGRSRACNAKGKSDRGPRYSVVEDPDVAVYKALLFVLKRAIQAGDVDEEPDDTTDVVVADEDGWVSVHDALGHSRVAEHGVGLAELQRIVNSAAKNRFELRQLSDTIPGDVSSFQIRLAAKRDSVIEAGSASPKVPALSGELLSPSSDGLPEFVIYGTSYRCYRLLVTLGAIRLAPGASFASFLPLTVSEHGSVAASPLVGDGADVTISINLRSAMETNPGISWRRTEAGVIVTENEVPRALWRKALARRPDIGVLLEDGEVRKAVPASLRGRGSKGKKKGQLRNKAGEGWGSASDPSEHE